MRVSIGTLVMAFVICVVLEWLAWKHAELRKCVSESNSLHDARGCL